MRHSTLSCAALGALAMLAFAGSVPAEAQQTAAKTDPKVQVIPGKWTKICDPEGPNRMCMTTIDSYAKIEGIEKPVWLASAAVREVKSQNQRTVMFRVPLHVRLKEGMLVRIDEGKVTRLDFEFCQAFGCEVVVPASDQLIGQLKAGGHIVLQFTDVRNQSYQVDLTLSGFTAAVDGPPAQVLKPKAVSAPTGGASGKGDAPAQ